MIPSYKTGNYETVLRNDTYSSEINRGFQTPSSVLTLVDMSAKSVSKHLPYSYVERNYFNMPELIARKIMFWSFPRCNSDIMRYYFDCYENTNYELCTLFKNIFVKNTCNLRKIVQIGFCVAAIVSNKRKAYYVSMTLDRCVITSVKCSCSEKYILWCIHAKSVASYRFHHGNNIPVYMPIFTTFNQLNRDQLQKLLQYILSYTHDISGIVRNVQKKLSNYTFLESPSRNTQDATTFLGSEDVPSWFFDIRNISSMELNKFTPLIGRLLKKVVEMMRVNDRNGLKILQFLLEERSSHLRDVVVDNELIRLWTFTLAAPHIPKEDKHKYCSLLDMWPRKENCFQWDFHLINDYIRNNELLPFDSNAIVPSDLQEKSDNVFLMPLCAGCLSWDEQRLKHILSNENTFLKRDSELDTYQEFIWREHLPTSCVRVRALQVSGYHLEAVRLSLAIARAIKHQSRRWIEKWSEIQLLDDAGNNAELMKDVIQSADGEWMALSVIKHRVNPLEILITSLVNASQIIRDRTPLVGNHCHQAAIEVIVVIFTQYLMHDDISWQKDDLEGKWIKIVSNAVGLQGKACCDRLLDHGVRDLIETLLKAVFLAPSGSSTYAAVPRYSWSLLMTLAIYFFDEDFAAKFVLACLQFLSRNLAPKQPWLREDRYKLLCFVVCVFPVDVAIKALDTCLKQKSIASIIDDFMLSFVFSRNVSKFYGKGNMFEKKEFIFHWLLEILHSSLFSNREMNGRKVLKIASRVSFEQTIYLLKNWEEYIKLSESMELKDFHLTFYEYLLTEEKNVFKNEILKLVLRFTKNEKEDKELIFKFLKSIHFFPKQHRANNIILTEEECNIINRKMFEVGLKCAEKKPREFLLHELPALVLDEDTFNAYFQLLFEALKQGTISPEDILILDVSRFTYIGNSSKVMETSQRCKYSLKKLCMKFCSIPTGYQNQGHDTTCMINHIIDVVQEADQISEAEANEIAMLIIANVKNTPVLFLIIKSCYELCVKQRKKPYWIKTLLMNGLQILESDTFTKKQRSKKALANHYKRLDELQKMLEE